jgi:hypothetical protein
LFTAGKTVLNSAPGLGPPRTAASSALARHSRSRRKEHLNGNDDRQRVALFRRSGNAAWPRSSRPRRRASPCHSSLLVLDGGELAFALSPGSVKGKSLTRDRRIAICVSDERQPYSFVTIGGEAHVSADADRINHVAAGIAKRYYPAQPAEAFAESFVQAGFTAVRVSITTVSARSGAPGLRRRASADRCTRVARCR